MHGGVWEKMNPYTRLKRDLSEPQFLRSHILRRQTSECFVVSLIPRLTRSSHDPFLFQFTMAARLHRNTRHELRDAENSWNRNIADRDYMLHYKNDNNRVEAAAEFRWPLLKLC